MSKENSADTLYADGVEQLKDGNPHRTVELWERALEIFQKSDDIDSQARMLVNIGVIYNDRLGDHRRAIDYFDRGMKLTKQIGGYSELLAGSLVNQGIAYKNLEDYDKAIDLYKTGLSIFRGIGNEEGEAVAINNLINLRKLIENSVNNYWNGGEFGQALIKSVQSLAISECLGDISNMATSYNTLGAIAVQIGDLEDSQAYYKKALDLIQRLYQEMSQKESIDREKLQHFLQAGAGRIHSNIGANFVTLGQYANAITSFDHSLLALEAIDDYLGRGNVLHLMSGAYYKLGNNDKALSLQFQALAVFREFYLKTDDPSEKKSALFNQGMILDGIGVAYSDRGYFFRDIKYFDDANKYLEEALEKFKYINNKNGEALTLSHIGLTLYREGKYPQALTHLKQSLLLREEMKNHPEKAALLANTGNIYVSLGEYNQALDFFKQSLSILKDKDIGLKRQEGTVTSAMAGAFLLLGNFSRALSSYLDAHKIFVEIEDIENQGRILVDIASIYAKLDDPSNSEKYLFSAIKCLEKLRGDLTDEQRISIFETQTYAFYLLQTVLVNQNKYEEALEISERSRARALVHLLQRKSDSYYIRNLPNESFLSFEKMQNVAQSQNATLVEYSIIPNEALYVWVIRPDSLIFRQLRLNHSDESFSTISTIFSLKNSPLFRMTFQDQSILDTVSSIRALVYESDDHTNTYRQTLRRLHTILIDPIKDTLPQNPNEKVIFIPHQCLFYVPFAALLDGESETAKYLIEKHTISVCTSIEVLCCTQEQRMKLGPSPKLASTKMLIVGDPIMPTILNSASNIPISPPQLEGARKEAEQIAEKFHQSSLTGYHASKHTIKLKMTDVRFIHFATHGLLEYRTHFMPQNIPGALVFAASEEDDGLLTATEIFDMELNAELAVLSACNTGQGSITGDGVIGLSRSFIAAGVPSLIVSLWSVPDNSTAELMIDFYVQLEQTQDKAKALREAMLRTKLVYPDPRNWAAFILIGESV